MDKKQPDPMRIGIILTGDYTWAGGLYYSLNLIKLLYSISDNKKLTIVVIVNASTPEELLKELPSENIELSHLDKKSFFYKLYYKIKGNRFASDINHLNLDVLYPLIFWEQSHKKIKCRVIYWLYDFQHKFLPQLFSTQEINSRDLTFSNISDHASDIVFSSEDSKKHFDEFYPQSKAKTHVFSFVSLVNKQINSPNEGFKPPSGKYFIVCNQFWPHKNHLVVLKALKQLVIDNKEIQMVFTGKYNDERSKSYVDELNLFIKKNNLQKHITFTGFISREEQISLIKNALAVIQPSLFEGWSTVVEDAKALNKFLILSDLAVHREQVTQNVLFFKPDNELQLASHVSEFHSGMIVTQKTDYLQNIELSKQSLINLFNLKS